MAMMAVAVPQAFVPSVVYPFEGYWVLEIPCHDYDEYRTQPTALYYDGRTFGRTGWNSDRCVAYYNTRVAVAYAV